MTTDPNSVWLNMPIEQNPRRHRLESIDKLTPAQRRSDASKFPQHASFQEIAENNTIPPIAKTQTLNPYQTVVNNLFHQRQSVHNGQENPHHLLDEIINENNAEYFVNATAPDEPAHLFTSAEYDHVLGVTPAVPEFHAATQDTLHKKTQSIDPLLAKVNISKCSKDDLKTEEGYIAKTAPTFVGLKGCTGRIRDRLFPSCCANAREPFHNNCENTFDMHINLLISHFNVTKRNANNRHQILLFSYDNCIEEYSQQLQQHLQKLRLQTVSLQDLIELAQAPTIELGMMTLTGSVARQMYRAQNAINIQTSGEAKRSNDEPQINDRDPIIREKRKLLYKMETEFPRAKYSTVFMDRVGYNSRRCEDIPGPPLPTPTQLFNVRI